MGLYRFANIHGNKEIIGICTYFQLIDIFLIQKS